MAARFLHAITPFDEDERAEIEETKRAEASGKSKALDDTNGDVSIVACSSR
jgi:hypothetical protein